MKKALVAFSILFASKAALAAPVTPGYVWIWDCGNGAAPFNSRAEVYLKGENSPAYIFPKSTLDFKLDLNGLKASVLDSSGTFITIDGGKSVSDLEGGKCSVLVFTNPEGKVAYSESTGLTLPCLDTNEPAPIPSLCTNRSHDLTLSDSTGSFKISCEDKVVKSSGKSLSTQCSAD